jgi:hypothetical protein
MNSQARVQTEINLYNQRKGWLVQVERKWCDEFNRDNFKQKLLQGLEPLGRGTIHFPIVFSVTLHGGYIKMTFFPKTPKWNFCCFKTLDIHIFLKSSIFGICKENIL